MEASVNSGTTADELIDSFYSDDEDWIDAPDQNLEEVGSQSKMKWKVIEPTLQNTKLHIAKADDIAWEQALTEIRGLEKSLCEITKKKTLNEVSELDVMNIFFGDGSKFGRALQNCLGSVDHEEMCQFMDIWCTQAILKGNVKRSQKVLDHFASGLSKNTFPVDEKTYMDMWKSISSNGGAKIGNDVNILRNSDNSWEELESGFNDTLRKIFVNRREGAIALVVDDDKDWCKNVGLNAIMQFGIKLHVFVRDNERGIVHHTTVTTALMLPLNIQTERKDDSSEICFRRGLNQVFGRLSRRELSLDSNCAVSADRGYISDEIVKEAVSDGADISGTCKRSAWFPFVYDQVLKPNDKRTLLDVHGSPALFLKEAKINSKIITAAAFRNGTDSISCTVSSKHHGHHWDGIPLNSREIPNEDKYFKRMKIEGTEQVHEQESTIIDALLIGLNVESTLQGTADWHLRRKFSLTSSQSDAVIRAIFSHVWTANVIPREHLNRIACAIYGADWQSRSRLLEEHEKDDVFIFDQRNELREFSSHFEMSLGESEEKKQAIEFISPYIVNDQTEETVSLAKQKVEGLGSNIQKSVIEFIVGRVEESKRSRFTKQDLVLFLLHKNDVRKWMCYKKDCLLPTASLFKVRSAKTLSQINLAKSMAVNECSHVATTNPSTDAAKEKAVRAVLVNSFQERFTGARKSSALTGHKCEPLLIANLVTGMKEKSINVPGVKDVVSVYTTGLVSMASNEAIKDSIDFIIIVQMESGEYECWGGEEKTRTEGSTANREETFHCHNRNVNGKFSESEDEDMYKNVAKADERFQLLHHAHVYRFTNVLHVVGDKNANIIHCLKVRFNQETMRSYGEILRYAKNYGLEWAYDDTISEIPDYVLNISKNIKTIGDKNALLSTFYLWKHVHTNFKHRPMPPLRRILPLQHSCWNLDKPGSDIATALADSIFFRHPHCNLNTRASNRMIQITFVAIHRLLHVLQMNRYYKNYFSVRQYRHEASRRHAFIDTIMKCRLQLFLPGGQGLQSRDPSQPTPAKRYTRTSELKPSGLPPSTGLTPLSTDKRKRQKLLRDSNDNAFKRRSESCPGIMKRIMCDDRNRGRCARDECGQKTYWFCIGCKIWLCNGITREDQCENRGWQKKVVQFPIDQGKKKGATRNLHFYETCSDIHHSSSHNAWAEEIKKNIFQGE